MTTQNALVVEAVGKPIVSVSNWPIPKPGNKQVLVRVTVSGLNPHDHYNRDAGTFLGENLPAVLANDVVGVVKSVGDGVSKFKVGDRVVTHAPTGPGYASTGLQQYAVLDEDFSAAVPEGITDDEAATLPTNLLAGVVAFFDKDGLALPAPWSKEANPSSFASSSILVVGGGSNTGRFGVQLASLVGFGTIVVVGGKEAELKGFGATHVLDRHAGYDTVLKNIRAIVGDDLLYAFDGVTGPPEQHLAINALSNSKKGQLARLVWFAGAVQEDKLSPKQAGYELRNIIGSSYMKPETAAPFWQALPQFLAQKKIKPLNYVTVKGLDAAKANEVLDAYRDKKPIVQTHFRVSE